MGKLLLLLIVLGHTTTTAFVAFQKKRSSYKERAWRSYNSKAAFSATHTMRASASTATDIYRDKTVLLTGATGGLGRAFALLLSQFKVSTLILSARNEQALATLAHECARPGLTIHCLVCDLANPASVLQLATDAIRLEPSIDMLINNGGVSSRSRFVDTTIDVDAAILQINFLAGAALAKALVPRHMPRGGKILWISSVQGLVGLPNRSSYAASKFAVQGYCESIQSELASDYSIQVHVASPGYIRTNLSKSAMTGDGTKYGATDATTEQGADPMDVASVILQACAKGRPEIVVAAGLSAKVAIWLRFLCPALLRVLLLKRYETSQQKIKDS
jgi:dehydrogenase/reductase SDR family protein 7B